MTMLESLAREEHEGLRRVYPGPSYAPAPAWENMAESYRVGRILGVRLLLELLRNPDKGMLEAMAEAIAEWNRQTESATNVAGYALCALIDHILNEEAGAE